MQEVKAGDTVRIRYTTRNDEGAIYETSGSRAPLEFVAGSEQVIPGVSQAVIGMQPGESRTVRLTPRQAFGERLPELLRRVPRSHAPEYLDEGDQLTAFFDETRMDVWVQKLDNGQVIVDANHPLAGEELIYDLELVGVDSNATD